MFILWNAIMQKTAIERIIEVTGKTPAEIAKAINASPQSVNNWQKRGISKKGAQDIAQAFNLSLDWILTGQGAAQIIQQSVDELSNTGLDYEPSTSTIELMETLKEMEKNGELTPQVVGLLNTTLNTFKNVSSGKRLNIDHLVEKSEE